jgi:hypothetical protein
MGRHDGEEAAEGLGAANILVDFCGNMEGREYPKYILPHSDFGDPN